MTASPTTEATEYTGSELLELSASFARHLRAAHRSPNTILSYGEAIRTLDAYLAANGMPRTIEGVRREHIEAFMVDQLDRNAPATAGVRYRSLQQFFRWLVAEDEIAESPMQKMRPPRAPVDPPEVVSDEAIRRLLAEVSGKDFDDRRDRAIISLFLDTAIRLSECAGIRTSDLDLDAGEVTVIGKGSRVRRVPFGAVATKALDQYLRARAKRSDATSDALWLGKRGPLGSTGIAQVIKRRGMAAGLVRIDASGVERPALHPHLFRHTAAHRMLSSGMQESDLMQVAGWQSSQMVRRYGASAAAERARRNYRKHSPLDNL